ncbi:MAG TPA: M48 family metallopeptidase [Actinomycetota bacterium]|nr:M48 family metallopeptidase [Actinomycetota bacterium]
MDVEIVRSPRRRKTISAEQRGGTIVVRVPAGMPAEEERAWVARMVDRLTARERTRRLNAGGALERAADRLNRDHFEGRLRWTSIRYVANQRSRFGSCTPEDATIRVSDRVADLPDWVRDYVVMHELAHLVDGSHSARFWELAGRYPRAERARGYLMALGMDERGDQPGGVS